LYLKDDQHKGQPISWLVFMRGDVRKAEELGATVNPEFIQLLKKASGK